MRFVARRCLNEACGLRFPVNVDSGLGLTCPLCNHKTLEVGAPYDTPSAQAPEHQRPRQPLELHGVLDNIRSLRNVGAIFRCADGSGLAHLHLCGFTPTPEHPKLDKTALGAQHRVPWSRAPNTVQRLQALRDQGVWIWGIEGGSQARSIFEITQPREGQPKDTQDHDASRIALVVGHEVSGVDPHALDLCHERVQIPMLGSKASLNVSVAFGIVAFQLRFAGAGSVRTD